MPTVTRLQPAGPARVRVEVDGERWRTLPATLVDDLGLSAGSELTRPVLRALRRRLRRGDAAAYAERILGASDTSTRNLAAALERRGVAPADRDALLGALSGSGLLSDARASRARAQALAQRGYGNAAIELKLEGEGYEPTEAREAIEELDDELARAKELLARKKPDPRQSARFLGQRGFDLDICEALGAVYDADV